MSLNKNFFCRIETFNHVTSWLSDAKNAARKDCSICLVGNKSDLKDLRQVSYNEAAKFSQNNSMLLVNDINRFIIDLLHLECSALNGENIEEAFSLLCKNIIKKIEEGIIVLDDNRLKKLVKPTVDEENQNEDVNISRCASC